MSPSATGVGLGVADGLALGVGDGVALGVGDGVGFGVRVGVSIAAWLAGDPESSAVPLPGSAATAIAPSTIPTRASRAMRTPFGERPAPGLGVLGAAVVRGRARAARSTAAWLGSGSTTATAVVTGVAMIVVGLASSAAGIAP